MPAAAPRRFLMLLALLIMCEACGVGARPAVRDAPATTSTRRSDACARPSATGCAVEDADDDGIAGGDRCPCLAEDRDGHEDEDGCPEWDNDGDSIVDACDDCPNEAETENGLEDADGCPDRAIVRIHDRIRVVDHVVFAAGSAELEPAALPLLDEIARVMLEHVELELVAVEGHASRGEPRPERLSERRAEVVRQALVDRGVEAGRLVTRGLGATRPLAPSRTERERALNRRVEFSIERRGAPRGERVRAAPERVPCPDGPPPPPAPVCGRFDSRRGNAPGYATATVAIAERGA